MVLHKVLGVVLGHIYGQFSGAAVGRDAVNVGPALVGPGVEDEFAVLAPEDLVDALVRRGLEFLEILALGVGDVEPAADDQGEFLPVRGDVRGGRGLPGEGAADLDAAGGDLYLRDGYLAGSGVEDVYLIVLQEHYRRAAIGN